MVGKYQESGMGTPKWPLLGHLEHDLRVAGWMTFLQSKSYESCDIILRNVYRKSSKHQVSAIDEAISRHGQNFAEKQILENRAMRSGRNND